LGGGKRLFADGTIPAAFKVTESAVTSKGVIIVNYERAGAVPPEVYKLEAHWPGDRRNAPAFFDEWNLVNVRSVPNFPFLD
jgi:hypothetical protein